jgi:hypothetical protein
VVPAKLTCARAASGERPNSATASKAPPKTSESRTIYFSRHTPSGYLVLVSKRAGIVHLSFVILSERAARVEECVPGVVEGTCGFGKTQISCFETWVFPGPYGFTTSAIVAEVLVSSVELPTYTA